MLWHSLESSCFVALTSNFISVARVGSPPLSDQFSINGDVPIFTPATPRETIETVTFFPGALALQQGDVVTFGIFRSGGSPNDTCTENSFLRGASVIYQGIQLFYDGFASGDPSAWTSTVP